MKKLILPKALDADFAKRVHELEVAVNYHDRLVAALSEASLDRHMASCMPLGGGLFPDCPAGKCIAARALLDEVKKEEQK